MSESFHFEFISNGFAGVSGVSVAQRGLLVFSDQGLPNAEFYAFLTKGIREFSD